MLLCAHDTGVDPEPRPGLPSGHFPGATNLPFTQLLHKHEDGGFSLHPAAVLRQQFAAIGIDPLQRPCVVSCGSGVTACIIGFSMDVIAEEEKKQVVPWKVYDGSWTEWASQQDPVILKGK